MSKLMRQKRRQTPKGNTARNMGLAVCGILLFFAALMASASPQSNAPTLTSTNRPAQVVFVATFTPRPRLTATVQVSTMGCATNTTINIRQGPGTQYPAIGGLASGRCIKIVGRNQDSSWVYMVTDDNVKGWVAAWLLTVDGNLSNVSVQNVSNPLPTSTVVSVFQPTKKSKSENSGGGGGGGGGGSGAGGGDSSGPTALCNDGTFSYSTNRSGTCSHHGGVKEWLK